jgi:adenylate cyclase
VLGDLRVIQQAVAEHHGTVIKIMGDAFLVDFPSVVHAVQCAQQIQDQFHTHCLSDVVYHDVAQKISVGTVVSLGRPKLKNIVQRFPVYALLSESPKGLRQTLRLQRLKLSRRVGTARLARAALVVMGLLIGGGIVTLLYPSRLPLSPQDSALRTPAQLALPLPDKPSIVVLPFDNMSKDPEQDYFSNGITEVLTSDLSRLSGLFVIARNTAFTYKGKPVNVQDVGKELGVRYVLEGSVQKAADQVRIVAQLVDATTGGHIWSERYDRPLKDIFALQDEIVQKIVTTLKLQLTLREQGILVLKTTDNLEAYDYFLRGAESFLRFTKDANVQARQMFEKAIELDPQYAAAYTSLGWTYFLEWYYHLSPDPQTLERAFELAQRAIALDDSLPQAHGLLSLVYQQKGQADQAIAEGERAIALNPNNADSYANQAAMRNSMGRPEEALGLVAQAVRLNPRYPAYYLTVLGWAYRLTGRYAEAVATLKEAISRNPNNLATHLALADSYVLQWASQQSPDPQTLEQALAAAQRTLALNDAGFQTHTTLGVVYLWQKQYEQASAEMERVIALEPNDGSGYAGLAEVLSSVGRPEEAVELVEKAMRLGSPLAPTPDWYLTSVGSACYLAGRTEEAIAPLKRLLT